MSEHAEKREAEEVSNLSSSDLNISDDSITEDKSDRSQPELDASLSQPLLKTKTNGTVWDQFRCTTYQLIDFHALPDYLRDNEFILRGYRANFSIKQAFESIFTIHNETGNIWTHLIGFLVFLILTIYTVTHWPHTSNLPGLPAFQVQNLTSALSSVELPSLASLQEAIPHLRLPQSLSSCFKANTKLSSQVEKDSESCVFAKLPSLPLPESFSSCFGDADLHGGRVGNYTQKCMFKALHDFHFPESLSTCFQEQSAAGNTSNSCLFDALWVSLQTSLPHLPESLSSCFHSTAAPDSSPEKKDVEQCLFKNLSHDVMRLFTPFIEHSKNPHPPITRWPFIIFLCGAMTCLFTSSFCHLLGCHSHKLNTILWRFDYAGIAALISTSFYPPVYYGFLCEPLIRNIYLTAITLMGVGAVLVSLLDQFQKPSYRVFRASLFFGIGISGVIPTAHKVISYWHERVAVVTAIYEVSMGAIYGLGAWFYASRVPERWLPGKFDIAGHSHQIFHVLVVAGALVHYFAGLEYLRWRDVTSCS